MTAEYTQYLAANVLSEGQIITYRALSRALKVNVTAAQEMLFSFYKQQNTKSPGCVHATYLISGDRTPTDRVSLSNGGKTEDKEDAIMQSSPPFSSSLPQQGEEEEFTAVTSFTLLREEQLDVVKSSYERIQSIQIYSLGPSALKDLQVLSDSNRAIRASSGSEDPLETWKIYGTIHNPLVRRRTTRYRPPSASATSAPATKPRVTTPNEEVVNAEKASSERKSLPRPPIAKRETSDLFKSFAKSKPKKSKTETRGPDASENSRTPQEDEVMKDASEDEQEEDLILPASRRTRDDQPLRRPKSEREEGLRKMMEDDDDEAMIDPPVSSEEESQGSPAIETSPIAVAQPEREKSEEPVVTVSNGRRRGKRKIMKKLTVKDEEGFLVTREEPVWESFSEDEPLLASKVKATSVAAKGAKKAGAKVGQGNITSFFAKK